MTNDLAGVIVYGSGWARVSVVSGCGIGTFAPSFNLDKNSVERIVLNKACYFAKRKFTLVSKALLFTGLAVVCSASLASDKPNIIVILSDDAGYSDLGFSGDANFVTPNITKLADRGVKFTQGYVSASVCSPSRAGLLTGRYQQRFGHEYNLPVVPEPGDTAEFNGLPVQEQTIADRLKNEGYHTGIIGKWHLGLAEQFHPLNRGFDEFYGLLGGGRSYFEKTSEDTEYRRIYRNYTREPFTGYLTDKLGQEAISFIENNHKQPFFLYLSYTAVHAPMDAKAEQEALFAHIKDPNRRKLAAMTLALDQSVGEVMAKLDELKLTDNTLVVFLNDNGGPTGKNASTNLPLSGVKGTLLEGGLRVPFVMSWPKRLPLGQTYDKVVSALDILPTSMAVARAKNNSKLPLDGVNLMPYLDKLDNGTPHETLFWRRAAFAAVRDGDHKLVRFPDRPAVLFNLATDPAEKHNLADKDPQRVRQMLKKLFQWETKLHSPLWTVDSKWIKQNRQRYDHYSDIEKM